MLLVRFVVVFLLLGNSFTTAQKQFVGFCGLRGAVPIALAIQAAAHPQTSFGVSGCLPLPSAWCCWACWLRVSA